MAHHPATEKPWIERSPRYRHAREDDNLVQVTHGHAEFECRYQDLSETGARCIARRAVGLNIGDLVEVTLPAPGALGSIVARGLVTRSDGEREFAVRFASLAPDRLALLRDSLVNAFAKRRFERARLAFETTRDFTITRWPMLLAVAVTCAIGWGAMSWLTAPRGNYSPDKTVPWGDRTF